MLEVVIEVYSLFGIAETDTDAVVFFGNGWPVTTVVVGDVNDAMVVVVAGALGFAHRKDDLPRSSLRTNFSCTARVSLATSSAEV